MARKIKRERERKRAIEKRNKLTNYWLGCFFRHHYCRLGANLKPSGFTMQGTDCRMQSQCGGSSSLGLGRQGLGSWVGELRARFVGLGFRILRFFV